MTFKSWPGLQYETTVFSQYNTDLKNSRFDESLISSNMPTRSWLYEDIQNKETLLMALGDSWTWGDSLCGVNAESPKSYDHPDRVKYIYGAKLANMLDSDFVNMGHCGGSNQRMLSRLKMLLSHNHEKYKKIYVIVTLTENCRDLENWKSKGSDQKLTQTFIDWFKSDEINKNFYKFLQMYERNMFLQFKSIFNQYKNVKFLIGRNFTYSFEENIEPIKDYHLEKNWIDCLNEHQVNIYTYPKDIRFLSQMSVYPIERYFKDLGFFDYIIEDFTSELDKGKIATDWLRKSPFNHKKATKHPTVEGHEIWAKYVYENFTKENS